MILTDIERRERSERSILKDRDSVRIRDCSPGRNLGGQNTPVEVKALVGTLANLESDTNGQPTTNKELAIQFGMHPNEVSAAKHGKIGSREDEELKKKIEDNLGVVRDRAMDKLLLSMGMIDSDKLSKCKAPDLARVASSMASVVEKVTPKAKEADGKNNVKILIHNMGQHREDHYTTVEVEA